MIKLSGDALLTSDINPNDYVLIHKSEIKSVIENANTWHWGAEIFSTLGTLILGATISLYFTPDLPSIAWTLTIILTIIGLIMMGWGIYAKCKKSNLINEFINKKLNEKD